MRIATIEDIDKIMEMCMAFAEESEIPANPETVKSQLENWINSEESDVMISDHGITAGSIGPCWWNHDIMVAQEHFWWVRPEHREKGTGQEILMFLEDWASSKGASAILMVALMSSQPEKASAIYIKNDYVPFEQSFIKYL